VQIYCDFSGYTDIAIGIACCWLPLPVNFDAPYTARDLQDFCDAGTSPVAMAARLLYIPLGGNRGSEWQAARNIMITMVLGGLWHGANWTFIIWARCTASARSSGTCAESAGSRSAAGGGRRRGRSGAAVLDVPVRVPRLGLLPGHVVLERHGGARPPVRLGPGSPLITPLLVFTIVAVLAASTSPDLDRPCPGAVLPAAPGAPGGRIGLALLVITTLGPTGVAPFIYYRF